MNWLLQVSGIRFTYDPSKAPGNRIVRDSVTIGSDRQPLKVDETYALATKQYLVEGRDGYDMFAVSITDR